MRFSRIQFTPDLMPSDVTGSSIWNQRDGDFEFRPGPIFTNLLLADEINRAPPKTQAALLEAMQERQVTIEGVTHPLEPPFLVIATQNPIEYEGTYPLPEAQLDRFLLRTAFGYPEREDEVELLGRRIAREEDEVELAPVVDRETLLGMQQAIETRPRGGERPRVLRRPRRRDAHVAERRPSARARAEASRSSSSPAAKAALAGRDFVLPDDVKAVAVAALAHRLVLRPELWVQRVSGDDVVREVLDSIPTPRPRTSRRSPMRTRGQPAARGLRGPRRRRPRRRARAAAPRACGRSRRRSRSCSRSGCAAQDTAVSKSRSRSTTSGRRGRGGRRVDSLVRTRRPIDRLELLLDLPDGVEVVDGVDAVALRLAARRGARAARPASLLALGNFDVGALELRCRSFLRIVVWEAGVSTDAAPEGISAPARAPARSSRRARRRRSRAARSPASKGDGSRVRGHPRLRPGRPSALDQLARIGPSCGHARRERPPSRAEYRRRHLRRQLHRRAAAATGARSRTRCAQPPSLAARYLERRDRVGLVVLRRRPALAAAGPGHVPALSAVESLLETGVEPTYTWRDVNLIPARILPPKALVLGVDTARRSAVRRRRSRTSARADTTSRSSRSTRAGSSSQARPRPSASRYRLWLLQREVLRARLARLGIAIARWSDDDLESVAVEGVRTFSRYARARTRLATGIAARGLPRAAAVVRARRRATTSPVAAGLRWRDRVPVARAALVLGWSPLVACSVALVGARLRNASRGRRSPAWMGRRRLSRAACS